MGYFFFISKQTHNIGVEQPILNERTSNIDIATPLADIPNYKAIQEKYGIQLTPAQEEYFENNRFLLIETDATTLRDYGIDSADIMFSGFDVLGGKKPRHDRTSADTVLITPDVILHAFNAYIHRTLEELETKELSAALRIFLNDLRVNLSNAYVQSPELGIMRERYMQLEARIALAQALLENKGPQGDTVQNAKRILALYSAHFTQDLRTTLNQEIDDIYAAQKDNYVAFAPPHRYVKNSTLRAYFRTMTYLGRDSYDLTTDRGLEDAALLTEQYSQKGKSGKTPFDSWKRIGVITELYAGKSDDVTSGEMREFVTQVFGNNPIRESDIISGALAKELREHMNQLRIPKNNPPSYRIFGQRFVFDAWVVNSFASKERSPSTLSALFIPAVLGNARAQDYALGVTGMSDSEREIVRNIIQEKRKEAVNITKSEWFSSFGGAWMFVLGSLRGSYGREYPLYMQSAAFADKQIQTMLGSLALSKYGELIHAQQRISEESNTSAGIDSAEPPTIKGYVEPNLEFWYRINALIAHTQEVFEKNDIFKGHAALKRLEEFKSLCMQFTAVATKELRNEPISDAEYELLRTSDLQFMSSPFDVLHPNDYAIKGSSLVTAYSNTYDNTLVYEATGKPYLMLVAITSENTPRVVAGLVYNHYEFVGDGQTSHTDESWRTQVYETADMLPGKNYWYDSLFAR